jgi:hypothetical protein
VPLDASGQVNASVRLLGPDGSLNRELGVPLYVHPGLPLPLCRLRITAACVWTVRPPSSKACRSAVSAKAPIAHGNAEPLLGL